MKKDRVIKGAIFDCDGTLTDSMHIWNNCGIAYLKYKGLEPPEQLDRSFIDFDLDGAVALLEQTYGIRTNPMEILADMFDAVKDEYLTVELKKGVRRTLDWFREQGIRMAVATGTAEYIIRPCLDRLGVLGHFDAFYSAFEERSSKREPHLFDKAAAAIGCSRGETLVFEDAYYAARTAREAGYIVVGIRNDDELKSERLRSVSDYYIEDLDEIIDLL